MKIVNEAARLFFAMTALILVGLLSAPMTGDLRMSPISTAKVTKAKPQKVAQDQKRPKLRKS